MSLPLFNRTLDQFGERIALKSDTEAVSYQSLQHQIDTRIDEWQACLTDIRPLVLIQMANSIDSVVSYLACLQARFPCILLNEKSQESVVNGVKKRFFPNLLINGNKLQLLTKNQHQLSHELAVLLSTSGSTGSKKFVALSYQNIKANTHSILAYMPVEKTDTTLGSLPLSYSYGLSILHTHLTMGACIRFTDYTVMDKGFWELLEQEKIASLNGVPSWYEMLLRLRFERKSLPNLRYFTQAGGKLSEPMVTKLAHYADVNKKQFFVMYGQTEATARIAYLPSEKVQSKVASVGQAVEGGGLQVIDENNEQVTVPMKVGELVFQGPNVMLGYVNSHQELSSFKSINILRTGDLGYFDEEGDFFITGRLKRMIKLYGERCSLDEVENHLNSAGYDVRCVGEDNKLVIFCATTNLDEIKQQAIKFLNVPPKSVRPLPCEKWPLLENGKTDYTALLRQVPANA